MEKKTKNTLTLVIAIVLVVMIGVVCWFVATKENRSLTKKYKARKEIVIEIKKGTKPKGERSDFRWVPLAEIVSYEQFREAFDSELGVIPFGNSKNGCVYVDYENGKWEPNNTLYSAYKNKTFTSKLEDEAVKEKIYESLYKSYADVTADSKKSVKKCAMINCYFNLLPDYNGYYNANSYMSRSDVMQTVAKAGNKSQTLKVDDEKVSKTLVDKDNSNSDEVALASLCMDSSFLNCDDSSLNAKNFTGNMTRAEAVYLVVKQYYKTEYKSVDSEYLKNYYYDDTKKYLKSEKEKDLKAELKSGKHANAYLLQYGINSDKIPYELAKAMSVSYKYNLLYSDSEKVKDCRWDEPITRQELMELIINTYNALGTEIQASNGTGNPTSNNGSLEYDGDVAGLDEEDTEQPETTTEDTTTTTNSSDTNTSDSASSHQENSNDTYNYSQNEEEDETYYDWSSDPTYLGSSPLEGGGVYLTDEERQKEEEALSNLHGY